MLSFSPDIHNILQLHMYFYLALYEIVPWNALPIIYPVDTRIMITPGLVSVYNLQDRYHSGLEFIVFPLSWS